MHSPKFYLLLLCVFLAALRIESEFSDRCPEGWDKFEDGCYMYDETRSDFDTAQDECFAQGGFLAEIGSAEENAYLIGLKGESAGRFWIGLVDRYSEGSFYWSASGSPVDYTNWKTGEPNDNPDSENCVAILQAGKWKDQNCGDEHKFFCERAACPLGWTYYDNGCYSYSVNRKDFDSAQAACNAEGGYVAEVNSAAENAFLLGLRSEVPGSFWIGWTDNSSEGSFYGAASGVPLDYTNWIPGEPDNVDAASEDCVEMYSGGKWNNDNCGDRHKYFCEHWW